MIVSLSGLCMEVNEKKDNEGKIIKIARIYQPGEKFLIDVKGVDDVVPGENIDFKVKLFAWANKQGQAFISCSQVQNE